MNIKTDNNRYLPSEIESKWQEAWVKAGIYEPKLDGSKSPFYHLMMFPYPSAEGLHVGNMYAFTGSDVYGRYMRMQGLDVFEPIGLDGFGIHSENYALKVNSHPMEQAKKSEENFYRQLQSIGSGFAWNRRLETYDIDYYRWTQWIFIQLFKAGLAYRAEAEVNWCPSCKTVLADEQVIDGKCERCSSEVVKKMLSQWFFRITQYAEELLLGLETIDWTERVKLAQKNWIGKSVGARVVFKIHEPTTSTQELGVFTTRPDTLFGVTFMVISPEHPFAKEIAGNSKGVSSEVSDYIQNAAKKSDKERRENKKKTGVFSGAYALNPMNNKQIPVWIADYVLMGYGTGAIMAVPAHDERDFEFANLYGLEVQSVIRNEDSSSLSSDQAYVGAGELVNSGEWDGLQVPQDISKVINMLEEKGIGQPESTYHLRDWLISRQRYWGPPIPMIFCQSCADKGESWFTHAEKMSKVTHLSEYAGWYPEEKLPVELPFIDDYKPLGTGKSPLGNHPEFYETTCPHCASRAVREVDVSDTFLDSSWYFLRYLATDLHSIPFPMSTNASSHILGVTSEDVIQGDSRTSWLPVAQYTGGAEHSVLHLLYTRFVYMVLGDLDLIDASKSREPFPKFFAHGLIIKDGAKMSKSKGNVVVPDSYIGKYGADTLRTYLMFIGPFSEGGDFRDSGIEGMHKFLKRVWVMGTGKNISSTSDASSANVAVHRTVKGVTEDLYAFRYNTAIAKIMTLYNEFASKESIQTESFRIFLQLLAPFAPHITEELWEMHGGKGSIHTSGWPTFDESLLAENNFTIAVQVNGKLRGSLIITRDEIGNKDLIESRARSLESVNRHIADQNVKKVIYIQGKIINFVI